MREILDTCRQLVFFAEIADKINSRTFDSFKRKKDGHVGNAGTAKLRTGMPVFEKTGILLQKIPVSAM